MIDYNKIAKAEKFYSAYGFSKVEVPWTVTKQISDITRPSDKKDFRLIHEDGKVLVASAEQSFLYQYSKGYLPKGKFLATTPCFRKEPFDSSHTKYFIKTELINTEDLSSLDEMVGMAFEFFSTFSPRIDRKKLKIVEIIKEKEYDITYDGVESGSYGIRHCEFLSWVYGTGCAEPRLSFAFNKK